MPREKKRVQLSKCLLFCPLVCLSCKLERCARVPTRVNVRMHVFTHTHTHTHTHTYAHSHAYTLTHTLTCMHSHTLFLCFRQVEEVSAAANDKKKQVASTDPMDKFCEGNEDADE